MKKVLLAVFLFSFVQSFSQKVIKDPNVVVRPVTSFSSIDVSGGIAIFLSQDEQEALAVSASEPKYRDAIKTTVDNGVLKISYDDGPGWNTGNKKLKAYISFRMLNSLKAAGATDVTLTGTINSSDLHIELSGASEFKGTVETGKLNIDQKGASDATIKGKAGDLVVRVSGASHLKGYDLESETCNVNASGASDVSITVNKELNANASGASSVSYRGQPTVTEKTGGASSVKRRG